jgi:putative endonuclease
MRYGTNTRKKGYSGEIIALNYLLKHGFSLIEKNYTKKGGEIDLIMKDNEYLVFVEVKSLRNNSSYILYESITKRKKKNLRKIINVWLATNNLQNSIWRADLLIIQTKFNQNLHKIEHIKFLDLSTY